MENMIVITMSVDEFKNIVRECINEHTPKPQEQPDPDEFLDINQAGTLLGVAKQTMYGKTHRNEIPYYKVGKKLLFKRSEISDYIGKNRVRTMKEIENEAGNILINRRKKY